MTATPQMQGAWEAPILWIGERPQPRGTCRHGRRGRRYVPANVFPPQDMLNLWRPHYPSTRACGIIGTQIQVHNVP